MSIEGTSAFSRSAAHLDVKKSTLYILSSWNCTIIQKLDAQKYYKDGGSFRVKKLKIFDPP